MGPAGPAGPGRRLVLSGRLGANDGNSAVAFRTLPQGLTLASTADAPYACLLRETTIGGPLSVTMRAPSQYLGANYAIVVVV